MNYFNFYLKKMLELSSRFMYISIIFVIININKITNRLLLFVIIFGKLWT